MSGTHCVLRAPASRIISSVNFPARSSFLTAPSLAVASGYRPCQPPAPAKGVVARDRSAIVARGYASKRGSDLPGLPPGLDAGQRESIARAVEQAQSATETWSVRVTGFLTPPVYTIAAQVLQPLSDVAAFPWGGYPQAERCRLLVGREEQILPLTEEPFTITDVAAMQVLHYIPNQLLPSDADRSVADKLPGTLLRYLATSCSMCHLTQTSSDPFWGRASLARKWGTSFCLETRAHSF
mmetsp:Transcript_5220/g.13474  ORF Transcript_5220/g.13474 Transcript_5220/m.13474 type:complete len:239 (-) Transcript_5220:440-1156(-)